MRDRGQRFRDMIGASATQYSSPYHLQAMRLFHGLPAEAAVRIVKVPIHGQAQ